MNTHTGAAPRPHGVRERRRTPLPPVLARRNALVEGHRHLVPPLASHYWRRCQEPRDDLIQVGLLGLIRAAELYRHSRQTPFSAFARPHIRGAILHYLRDGASAVRLPRRQSELRSRLARLEEQQAQAPLAPQHRDQELCQHIGMTMEQWRLLRRHRQLCRPAPLDPELLDQLPAPEDPCDEGPEEGDQPGVEALLAGLDARSQQVLRWVVLQGWSYRRAAEALDVSVMTVHRCLHRGLDTLRHQLSDTAGGPCRPRGLTPGRRCGRVPSAAQGWPSRHSPPPAAAPARLAKR